MSEVSKQAEQAATVPASQDAPAVLDAAIAKATESAAALVEAGIVLDSCVVAFRKGETDMKAGLLDAGRLADQYVSMRLKAGNATRESASKAVSGRLAEYASSEAACDATALIKVYHSWRLLAVKDETGAEQRGNLPYGHYVNALAQLVTRTAKDTGHEAWSLLPGMESDCLSLFREVITQTHARDALKSKVKALTTAYTTRQAEAREAARKEADQKLAAARKLADDAKAALASADESGKGAASEALATANEQAKQAEAERKRADRAEKAAKARAEKLLQERNRQNDKPQGETRAPEHNPLVAAKNATAKDLAESLIAQMKANPKPDDVLAEVFRQLDWRKKHAGPIVDALGANPGSHVMEFVDALGEQLYGKQDKPSAPIAKVA